MEAEKSMGAVLTVNGTIVAGVTSISEQGGESDEIDTTSLDNESGYKTFIGGLKDGGTVNVEGFIKDESNYTAMLALFEAQTVVAVTVVFLSGATLSYDAFVKSFKHAETKVDNARGFNGQLRISGPVSYEEGEVSA